jgi:hypothetical protein
VAKRIRDGEFKEELLDAVFEYGPIKNWRVLIE